nr:uncharacterized protein LOC101236582 isoform X1 [Hydra vulgaris]
MLIFSCNGIHGVYESFALKEPRTMKANSLLATLKTLPREYEITFEVNLTSFVSSWTNILHFTIGSNNKVYGDRTPSVYIYPNYTGMMQICAPVNGIGNYAVPTIPLKLLKWIKVTIKQLLYRGFYNYSIEIPDVIFHSIQNNMPKLFQNVQLFISDPWTVAQPGYIRNLIVTNACANNDIYCKPLLKVSFDGILDEKMFNLSLQIIYAYEPGEMAVNVTWEYVLPSYLKVTSESASNSVVKVDSKNLKFRVPFGLSNIGINQSIITAFNMSCTFSYKTIEIPIKLYFENSAGKSWNLFKTIKKDITKNCKSQIIPTNPSSLLEYYGRGIYWDDVDSQIYLCMNQHVTSIKAACYVSKSYGKLWADIDTRIGSVLGHHNSSRELYALHRNKKLYMKFHLTYKSWVAVTNDEFIINILSGIDWKRVKSLEGNFDQVFSFGTKHWMGNSKGLYFRNSTDDMWVQTAKWNL